MTAEDLRLSSLRKVANNNDVDPTHAKVSMGSRAWAALVGKNANAGEVLEAVITSRKGRNSSLSEVVLDISPKAVRWAKKLSNVVAFPETSSTLDGDKILRVYCL
jgi:hypothetical protein